MFILYIIFITLIFGIIAYYNYYCNKYYNSDDFLLLKNDIKYYVDECNQLNDHISILNRNTKIFKQAEFGSSDLIVQDEYNFKRKNLKHVSNDKYTYNCSINVCRNAQVHPFRYLCKYFNIEINEETLHKIEELLNTYLTLIDAKTILDNKKDEILDNIMTDIPFIIKTFNKDRLIRELGFKPIKIHSIKFPVFTFLYVSSGGNSSLRTDITLDEENLNKLIIYLNDKLSYIKSAAGQRALMTSSLRNKIKERDNYTCRCCGNSIYNEPNLLLEIDHIIPISKGGLTEESNLQTLCWKCNRTKGAKINKDIVDDAEDLTTRYIYNPKK